MSETRTTHHAAPTSLSWPWFGVVANAQTGYIVASLAWVQNALRDSFLTNLSLALTLTNPNPNPNPGPNQNMISWRYHLVTCVHRKSIIMTSMDPWINSREPGSPYPYALLHTPTLTLTINPM